MKHPLLQTTTCLLHQIKLSLSTDYTISGSGNGCILHFSLHMTSCKRALYCRHRIWITGKTERWGVFIFQLYGTFFSLVRLERVIFFPSRIPTSPAPDLLCVYYVTTALWVTSQLSNHSLILGVRRWGLSKYGHGWGRNIAAGALELLEHSAATVMAERRAFAQKISR